jgi:ABC-type glycerol-3-phosphate transport system permease component
MPERPRRKMAETFFVSAILVLLGSYALVTAVRLLRTIAAFIIVTTLVVTTVSVLRNVRRRNRDGWH